MSHYFSWEIKNFDYKKGIIICGEKMKPQVGPDHILNEIYDSNKRFCTYWYQINENYQVGFK